MIAEKCVDVIGNNPRTVKIIHYLFFHLEFLILQFDINF